MRPWLFLAGACALMGAVPGSEFAGVWVLNGEQSQIASLPTPVATRLEVLAEKGRVKCEACGVGGWNFTVDGKASPHTAGGHRTNIQTKWEGSALLISAIVTGPKSHVVSDRWKLSRGGRTLTITRQVQRGLAESESTLVYDREGS